jgi:hypothetical protein
MNNKVKKFQDLNVRDKIEFFVKCQDLLSKYHNKSDFVIRQNNIESRILHAKNLIQRYQGLCYMDDNVCVLFNKINIDDPNKPIPALRAHMMKPPIEHYNAVSIDFVVFRNIKDCASFCQQNYDTRTEYVVYIKGGKPKIYKTRDFISHIFQIPVSLPLI